MSLETGSSAVGPRDAAGEARPGYIQVLRECPDFRRLYSARVISLCGDWFSLIAIVALLREVVGSSPTALAGVLILKLLPIFLATPVAGVVADRFGRKGIMIGSDVIRTVLVLGLLAAPLTPYPVQFAYLLVVLKVVASAFFEPARAATLPQLVPDRYLATANALGAVSWSVVFALGAALGGLVTDLLGWRVALGIDAATYVVSALFVSRISLPRRVRIKEAVDWLTITGLRDFGAGMRFIAGCPEVATVIFAKTGWGIAGAITLFLTLFGERDYAVLGRPDLGVALLYLARAVGTGIGPVLARRFVTDESPPTMRRLLGLAFLWPAAWYVVFAFVHDPATAAIAVVLAHFGGSVLWVYSTVLLQRMVPNEYLGRVMSTDLGLATLTISASIFVYGELADVPGADLRSLVLWLALTLLLPAVAWLVASKRWPVGLRCGTGMEEPPPPGDRAGAPDS
jgi:MFS family permease